MDDNNQFEQSNQVQPPNTVQLNQAPVRDNDDDNFGWCILGFCVPIVGLILWLVWRDEKPRCAKRAGTGALILLGVWAAFFLLYFMIIMFAIVVGIAAS